MTSAQPAPPQSLDRRTFAAGVANESLFMVASAFIDSDTLLPAFVVSISEGNILLVGLLSSLFAAGWYWPQIFASQHLDAKERILPYYGLSAAFRTVCICAVPIIVYFWGLSHPLLTVLLISVCLFLFTSAGGFGMLVFLSVLRDGIPSHKLGRFYGLSYLLGGITAFASGFWIKKMLGPSSPLAFPVNYSLVFGIGAVLFCIAAFSFLFAREKPKPTSNDIVPMRIQFARAYKLMRENANLRRLAKSRLLYGAAAGFSTPFVVAFALKKLGMPVAAVGLLLSLKVLVYSLSNIVWGTVRDRHGSRRELLMCSVGVLLVPILTLSSPLLPDTPLFRFWNIDVSAQLLMITCAIMCMGTVSSGQLMGFNSFLIELIPAQRRQSFLGAFYFALLPSAVVPLLGALLIGAADRFWLGMLFSIALGITMIWEISRLKEIHV